jgi:XRE family transcriptional regulator, fatty acid utilization regulator
MDPAEPKDTFGENLARIRLDLGLTQVELSNRSGLDMAEISRLENGRRDPKLSTIARVAGGLGVSVEELVCGVAPIERYPPF